MYIFFLLNFIQALKYDENYRIALENLDEAVRYDPLWNEPKEQMDLLIKHLENMQNLIERKVRHFLFPITFDIFSFVLSFY